MNEDGNDTDRRDNLKTLVSKKRVEQKKSLPGFNTNLTPKASNLSFQQDGTKYRKVNLNGEIEDPEQKMKQTLVQLKRVIESQKNELLKMDKQKKENLKYIAKLEGVLNDEINKRVVNGQRQSLNMSSGSIKNKLSSKKGLDNLYDFDTSRLKELFYDSKAFVNAIGNMLIELESTIETMQTIGSTKESPNKTSTLYKKKETITDISSFEGGRPNKDRNERMDRIISSIRTNYLEFSNKLDNKYTSIVSLPENDPQNTSNFSSSVLGTTTTNRFKSKIGEFNGNKIVLSEKKPFSKIELEKKQTLKKNYRGSAVTGNITYKNSLNKSCETEPLKRFNSNTSPKHSKLVNRLSSTNAAINDEEKEKYLKAKESIDIGDFKTEGIAETEKKMAAISKRAEKRQNTLVPTHNSILPIREAKRQNTICQGIEAKKMSSIIKHISSKRMSTQATGTQDTLANDTN